MPEAGQESDDLLIRVDRVQSKKYWENAVGRLADPLDGQWGDLFLTRDGLVGFLPVGDPGPLWTERLDQITQVTEARTYGSAVPVFVSGTGLRARFGQTRRTIFFSGVLPGGLNAMDKLAWKLPTHSTAGLGKMYVASRVLYTQTVTLPKEQGLASSFNTRGRMARLWWHTLLTGPTESFEEGLGRAQFRRGAADEMPTEDGLSANDGLLPEEITPVYIQGLSEKRLHVLPALQKALPENERVQHVFGIELLARHNWKHLGLIAMGQDRFTIVADNNPPNSSWVFIQEPYSSISAIRTRRSELTRHAVCLTITDAGRPRSIEFVCNLKHVNDAIVSGLREHVRP